LKVVYQGLMPVDVILAGVKRLHQNEAGRLAADGAKRSLIATERKAARDAAEKARALYY
jgi:hypothetical protein